MVVYFVVYFGEFVFSLDENTKRMELSLKQSVIDPNYVPSKANGSSTHAQGLAIADLKKGMKIAGTIKSTESFGVFIKIDDSALSGLCHISEVRFFFVFLNHFS